jgi:hypothetical protein
MGTRMDNSIHIQVQVVEFHLIGIGFCGVNGLSDAIALLSLKINFREIKNRCNLNNFSFN